MVKGRIVDRADVPHRGEVVDVIDVGTVTGGMVKAPKYKVRFLDGTEHLYDIHDVYIPK